MSQKRFAASDTKFSVVVIALGLVVTLMGLGFTSLLASQQTTIQNNQANVQSLEKTINQLNSSSGALSGGAYTLTIVVANNMNQTFDPAMGPVPQYYVLGPKGLMSSADITVPGNTTIKLVVVCYDNGANNVSQTLATVSGTLNNSMVIFNGTSPTPANYVGNVHSVPESEFVSHTFTISSLGINVPIPSSSIVVTYLRFNSTGTFTWNCFSPCIGEPYMQTVPGYMEGTLTVT
jgi:hypothetical protein